MIGIKRFIVGLASLGVFLLSPLALFASSDGNATVKASVTVDITLTCTGEGNVECVVEDATSHTGRSGLKSTRTSPEKSATPFQVISPEKSATLFQVISPAQEFLKSIAANGQSHTYKVTKKKGTLEGIGAEATLGAWVTVKGSIEKTVRHLEKSRKYEKLKNGYDVKAGVNAFFGWLSLSAGGQAHKEEVKEVLEELSNERTYTASVKVDMKVTGVDLHTPSYAQAYLFVMEIEDESGNKIYIASDGAPKEDVGAIDTNNNNNEVETQDNESTVTF
ncbi:MAG: hypothetical protein VSS75_017110 [Candidatus Parabeggiatoa sp.]|nr:hypothetical protein [Candidatus Parabeggiatoa sp.]